MGGMAKRLVTALLFGVLFAPSVLGAVMYKSTLNVEDYRAVIQSAISNSQVQQLLGSGENTIELQAGAMTANARVKGTTILSLNTGATGNGDFVIVTSQDMLLSIVNAPEPSVALQNALAQGKVVIRAKDAGKQVAISAALSSGLIKFTAPQGASFGKYMYMTPNGMVLNKYGGLVGYTHAKHALYSAPPAQFGIYFNKPPGVLHQFPGLVYDTVTKSPNVMGPHNVFKINPGLVGPDKILAQNPGLIGPADMALLNPNLHGPAEFAYMMGIGAHSNSAKHLQSQGMINSPFLGVTNRWGGSVTIRP